MSARLRQHAACASCVPAQAWVLLSVCCESDACSIQLMCEEQVLMAAASAAAAGVLPFVNPWIAVCSLCLNFLWRKHDFACVAMLMAASAAWAQREWIWSSVWDVLHQAGRQRMGMHYYE